MGFLAALWDELVLLVVVLVVGAFARRGGPHLRPHARRMTWLFGTSLVFAVAGAALMALGVPSVKAWAGRLTLVGSLAAGYAAVSAAGLVVFDLALPALRTSFNKLTAELLVGVGYVIATLAVLRASGMDAGSVLTTSAIVSGVLALSLQATLGNILGGIALQLDGSIQVGDWVQLDNGKQGKVVAIRWRHTVLETRDWDQLIVPNAMLLAGQILILGKRQGQGVVQHRMTFHFAVDHRTAPHVVTEAVEQALRASPIEGVAVAPPPVCQLQDLARDGRDHAANYLVRYWLQDLDRDDLAQSRVRMRVVAALARAQVPLAVPERLLRLSGEPDGAPRVDHRPDIVQRLDLFASLSTHDRAELAKALEYTPYLMGEVIARVGDDPRWLYILAAGKVSVLARGPDDTAIEVAQLEAPDFFGEMGLMTGEPRNADVVALTHVESYRLERKAFERILLDDPPIVERISETLAKRKIALEAAREGLDFEARRSREVTESKQLIHRIRDFFGLRG